jgi:hypothetical protein
LPSSSDPEHSKYQLISNFIQEQQQKNLPLVLDDHEAEQDLFSPLTKKKHNANLSHFSTQTESPARSNYSNFDDNSNKKNHSLFQEFSLQNFIRKRNSEILKNLSRGSLLCPAHTQQKELASEEHPEVTSKPGEIQVLNFEDHYALKRVSMNLNNNPSKGITPLIMLHKKNLMKKVIEGAMQNNVQTSDSENNTDDDNSHFNEEDELALLEDFREMTLLQVNLVQSSSLNFQEIVNENKKKCWKNVQDIVNSANMMDNSEELDINAMIKKRIIDKNINVFEKEEKIYRKCMLKHLKILPFYLFDYESSVNSMIKVFNDKYLFRKADQKTDEKIHKNLKENHDFLFTNFKEPNGLQICHITLGNIESEDKKTIYNSFIRKKQEKSDDLIYFTSFQGKFLHTHQMEVDIMKNSNQRFKDHIQIQMKQCSEQFLEDIMNDLNKSENCDQHIKTNLIEMLSKPKLFIKDLGSKMGTFAKLKSNNPIILDKNLLVMLTGHLGFFVEDVLNEELAKKEFFEYERVCINEEFKEIGEAEDLNLRDTEKNNDAYLKIVFVKKSDELQLFEEYRKVVLVFRKNHSECSNCVKLGKQQQLSDKKTGNEPMNFLEKIRVKYDCYLAFDEKENLWFLVASNEEKITMSLTSIHGEQESLFLNYQIFNKLQEKLSFNSNNDLYNSYKNEEKIVCGVNTVDKFVKNESLVNLNANLVDEGLGNSDYFNKPSCWVCLAKFNLLQNKFFGENIEVGDGSIVKFGGNQILIRKIMIKEIPTK